MAETNAYGRRVCLVVGVEAYSALNISGQVRQWDTLDLLYDTAAMTAGLDPASWYRQAAGDGILAVLPEGTDGAQVLADFTGELGIALNRHNATLLAQARLRLRVALALGPVYLGPNGWTGEALVAASRLADSAYVREALTSSPDADMAVAAGENLYNDAVRRKLRGLRPEEWTRVRIEAKGFGVTAYVSVPGHPALGNPVEPGDVPDGRDRSLVQAGGPRWLVSAPASTDLRPLLAGLEERGVAPYVVSDVARLGGSILASQLDAVRDADAVLVVLAEAAQSLNPAFEAGLAAALRKPLAVIAPPGAAVPSGLAGFLVVRARPDDLEAIHFALDQAEAWVPATAPFQPDVVWASTGEPVHGPASGGALGARADDLLARAEKIRALGRTHTAGRAFADVLAEAIEDGGAVAVQAEADYGYDLGVWSDELGAIASNPLLVELKISLSRQAVRQALRLAEDHPTARAVLLVYLDPADPAALRDARFPVLAVSLSELLARMRDASFAEAVRQLRNQSVHGPAAG